MNDSSVSRLLLHPNSELPSSLEPWFWDCDFASLTWECHSNFIIRRILDRGDWYAITWLRSTVGDERIRQWFLAKNGGGLDPRKLRFLELVLDLPAEKVDEWVSKARESNWHGRVAQ